MARLLMVVLLLAGCAPAVRGPSLEERCQASTNPALCTIVGWQVEAEVAAEVAPVYQPSQRVFIRAWHEPGTPFRNAPLGYFDIP
jgi:hypothetical protein